MSFHISYQGHTIHVSLHGQGPPLLFLHGWPTNGRLWKEQVAAFSTSHTVLTLDWLGFGKSDKPEGFSYTFSSQKEQLDAVIRAAGWGEEKVSLIVHDIGGPPAILWAHEHPTQVKRLVLLNTVLYPLKTPMDAMSELLFSTPGISHLLLSPFGLRYILKSNTRSKRPLLGSRIREVLTDFQHTSISHKRNSIHHPMSEGRKQELLTLAKLFKALPLEKHLIIAKEDPLCYAHIHKLSLENPDVPTHYIQKCGHYMPLDRPGELTKILERILG
ncbi:MAG: alpha/beta fold hydrolase [Bacteroidota bacterium]